MVDQATQNVSSGMTGLHSLQSLGWGAVAMQQLGQLINWSGSPNFQPPSKPQGASPGFIDTAAPDASHASPSKPQGASPGSIDTVAPIESQASPSKPQGASPGSLDRVAPDASHTSPSKPQGASPGSIDTAAPIESQASPSKPQGASPGSIDTVAPIESQASPSTPQGATGSAHTVAPAASNPEPPPINHQTNGNTNQPETAPARAEAVAEQTKPVKAAVEKAAVKKAADKAASEPHADIVQQQQPTTSPTRIAPSVAKPPREAVPTVQPVASRPIQSDARPSVPRSPEPLAPAALVAPPALQRPVSGDRSVEAYLVQLEQLVLQLNMELGRRDQTSSDPIQELSQRVIDLNLENLALKEQLRQLMGKRHE